MCSRACPVHTLSLPLCREWGGGGTMGGDENVTIVVKYRRLGNFKVEL